MKKVVTVVGAVLVIGAATYVPGSANLQEQGPSRSISYMSEDIRNVSSLERPGVPYMVRRNVPGTADAIIYRFDYEETSPRVLGEFDASHYFTYSEVISWLDRWNRAYPGLTEVISIGKTYEGRDIWVLAVTNEETGHRTRKPAMWMGGGRHSGEVTGTVAVMDFAHRLITGYDSDPGLTELVDHYVYYLQPMENPDGAELYLNTVHRNRSTNRPYDQNRSGIADDDIEQDLDGDGYITQMRQYVGEGNGTHQKDPRDPSGRLMTRARDGEGDYVMYSEGIDVDGDGRINSDTIGGLDLHRQDSHAWRPMSEDTGHGFTQRGGSQYPYSEPEIRSLFQFLLANSNISIAQTMHTAVPMILRGPSSSATGESMWGMDEAYVRHFDEEGLERTGYTWAGDTHEVYSSRRSFPVLRQSNILGHSLDWGYFQYGAFWYGDELWGEMREDYLEDYNDDGEIDDLDALHAHDDTPGFEGIFIDWEPFDHPDLGEVEIGGWNYKFWQQNPPPAVLKDVVERQNAFNFYLAESLPRLVITGVEVTRNPDETRTITATIENRGFTPDATKQAHMIKIVRRTQATLDPGPGVELVEGETIRHEHEIPLYGTAYITEQTNARTQELSYFAGTFTGDDGEDPFFSKERGGPGPWQRVQQVSWIVRGTGEAEISVRSTRGGWPSATVTVR
ncbi:MAG: M14 family metallopeptidase [bacterium]